MRPFTPPVYDYANPLERKARLFHRRNPHVFALAEELAAMALSKQEAIGIGAIWERMRWHYAFETEEEVLDPDTGLALKLNNNHRAYYSRWLLERNPQWKGRIRIRQLSSGDLS